MEDGPISSSGQQRAGTTSQGPPFFVRFWGVRGSIACPGSRYARYGGNTSCLEVRCGDRRLILDAGTGLREFGLELAQAGPLDVDLFLTHTHLDHIAGVPFFEPFFDARNRFRIWAGHLRPKLALDEVLHDYMAAPLFPVPPAVFDATVSLRDFEAGETLKPADGVTLRTAPLRHPNGATGYRVEFDGRAACYVTDTEHDPARLDERILGLIAGADVVIYDCTYTDEEFPAYEGWGHSTWQEGVRLCDEAGVGKLVIFHHDPGHDDEAMDRIGAEAERARPGTQVAREGMVLDI